MFEFLSYGFGSVFGGFLTSIIIVGGIVFFALSNSKKGQISPIGIIAAFILFCLLFYHSTEFFAAWNTKDFFVGLIGSMHTQFGGEINGQELSQQVHMLIAQNPVVSFFIDYGDLEDVDWEQPISSLKSIVAREFNYFMLHRVLWMLAFSAIFGFVIFKTTEASRSTRRKKARSYSNDDDSSYDYSDDDSSSYNYDD